MLADAMMGGLTSGGNPASRLSSRSEAIRGLIPYKAKALLDVEFDEYSARERSRCWTRPASDCSPSESAV
jgi:hypothetical protein